MPAPSPLSQTPAYQQRTYPSSLPAMPAPAVARPVAPPSASPGVALDQLVGVMQDVKALLRQNLTVQNDVREYLRLLYLGQVSAPAATRTADVLGTAIGTSPTYTELYQNSGRQYSIGVRVQAEWNTPGGWVYIALNQGSNGNVFASLQNGLTDATTGQFMLAPNDRLYIAVAPASAGGVPLSALDKFRVLVSDDSNVISGQNRRFRVEG